MTASAGNTLSSDTDADEEERIRSVAVDSAHVLSHKNHVKGNHWQEDEDLTLKFYQIRAREFLYAYLDKTFEIIPANDTHTGTVEAPEDSGFYLFKNAPSGLSDKEHKQGVKASWKRKVPNIDIHENSETFQSRLLATAIDGAAVKLHAEKFKERARIRWTSQQAEGEKQKQEEDHRISLLKLQRGELWLPSLVCKGDAEM